jgi:hypothetical protein
MNIIRHVLVPAPPAPPVPDDRGRDLRHARSYLLPKYPHLDKTQWIPRLSQREAAHPDLVAIIRPRRDIPKLCLPHANWIIG